MFIKSTYLLAASCLIVSSNAELLVYEPFDYAPANHERFGALIGRSGGLGFQGPWDNEGKGYQIAGFGWHQGWNDNLEPKALESYEANLADFIRDIRHEFGQPKLPFTIGATGHGGEQAKGVIFAQLAVADPKRHPEFEGNFFCADTRPFWRDHSISPANDDSHWNANGESYFLIGDAMGKGLVEILKAAK